MKPLVIPLRPLLERAATLEIESPVLEDEGGADAADDAAVDAPALAGRLDFAGAGNSHFSCDASIVTCFTRSVPAHNLCHRILRHSFAISAALHIENPNCTSAEPGFNRISSTAPLP
jgi:hypothetical protein